MTIHTYSEFLNQRKDIMYHAEGAVSNTFHKYTFLLAALSFFFFIMITADANTEPRQTPWLITGWALLLVAVTVILFSMACAFSSHKRELYLAEKKEEARQQNKTIVAGENIWARTVGVLRWFIIVFLVLGLGFLSFAYIILLFPENDNIEAGTYKQTVTTIVESPYERSTQTSSEYLDE
jgi:protein-S-isoprenylcysteine O-methyltransferase Ste14